MKVTNRGIFRKSMDPFVVIWATANARFDDHLMATGARLVFSSTVFGCIEGRTLAQRYRVSRRTL